MVHEIDLLVTLAGCLSAALVCGYVTHRLGLSPIAGYLLAGVALGPFTPGFTANSDLADQLSEVGVVLLMFGVGLQFRLDELLSVRRIAVPGAFAGVAATLAAGGAIAHALGGSWTSSLFFGVTLSVASTVVLVRVLADRRELHTPSGHVAVGWLVVEDILTVVLLVLLPALVGGTTGTAGILTAIALTLIKIAALIAIAVVVGQRVLPVLLDRVAATRSRELFTLTVLAIALGLAVGSAQLFGVSMALGAFLAGMVVGRSDYSLRAATDALPMRDAFAVLFFVSIGMLLDPRMLLTSPALAIGALLTVLLVKPLVAAGVLVVMRSPLHTVLTVSSALGQIGEFSFILGRLGRELRLLPDEAMNAIVAASIGSILINPMIGRLLPRTEAWFVARRRRRFQHGVDPDIGDIGAFSPLDPRNRAVVVGYGPTGQTVTRLLRDNGVAPTIVELNMDAVRALRQEGVSAVYGDARHPQTLVSAGLRRAATLIVSGDASSPDVIANAREINKEAVIFVRGAYLRDVSPLRRAGATEVFSGEGEVALAMTEAVLRRLGATPDQIDRERRRVHEALSSAAIGPD